MPPIIAKVEPPFENSGYGLAQGLFSA